MLEFIQKLIAANPLVTAFAFIGIVIWISNWLARHVFHGHVASSAIAVLAGLALAYWGALSAERRRGLLTLRLLPVLRSWAGR
jgi:hypothetical protein